MSLGGQRAKDAEAITNIVPHVKAGTAKVTSEQEYTFSNKELGISNENELPVVPSANTDPPVLPLEPPFVTTQSKKHRRNNGACSG